MKFSLILASALLFSCSGGDDGGGGGNGGGNPTPQTPNAGSLSLGVVKFDMKATNLKDPNVSSNPQAGSGLTVQPGSLAIGASLTTDQSSVTFYTYRC